jgi:hypothetical protein
LFLTPDTDRSWILLLTVAFQETPSIIGLLSPLREWQGPMPFEPGSQSPLMKGEPPLSSCRHKTIFPLLDGVAGLMTARLSSGVHETPDNDPPGRIQ